MLDLFRLKTFIMEQRAFQNVKCVSGNFKFHQHLIDDRFGVGHASDSHEVGHDVDRDGEHDG